MPNTSTEMAARIAARVIAAKPTKLKDIRQMEELTGPLKVVQSPGPATKHGLVWFKDGDGKLFEYKPRNERESKKMMQYMGHSDIFPMHGKEKRSTVDRVAGAAYSRTFQSLVKVIDAFDAANKSLQRKGVRALQDIKDAVAEDQEFARKDQTPRPDVLSPGQGRGNLMYGLNQQFEGLTEALSEANEAASSLNHAYDELNRWALKHLK